MAAALGTTLLLIAATVVTSQQMLEAQRQRDAALYQSKRAEFQAQFAYHLFTAVADDGAPITLRRLLAKGIEVLDANYDDDPRFVIGMLINMSGRYMDLGDTDGELAALVRAEQIARQHGDPELIAKVQCNTVETELAAGRPDNAAARLAEGMALVGTAAGDTHDQWIECRTAQARLLWSQGDVDAAVMTATAVADDMDRAGERDDLHYQTVGSMLELMLAESGRFTQAMAMNSRRIESLERVAPPIRCRWHRRDTDARACCMSRATSGPHSRFRRRSYAI
ncbi:MAG: hypothetical protein HC809_10345 [Gammaproteobacteria bacterium]|nr:hypothetical protein [Gammaproteobacteria bacterium]